jgi:acyl-CoA hydrolase
MELWSGNLLLWKNQGSVNYSVIKPVAMGETVKVTAANGKSSTSTSKMQIASFSLSKPEASAKRATPGNVFFVTVTVSNSGDKTGVASVSLFVDGKNVGTQRVNVKGRSTSKSKFAAATDVKKERYAKVRATLSDGKGSQEVTIPIIPFY